MSQADATRGPAVRARSPVVVATAALVAVGLLFRVVRYLADWPLWGDEAFLAVSLLTRDLAGLTGPLEYYQIAPPGFLWAELASVRLLGTSERALRLLPFLSGIGSLLLFWRFAAGNLGRRAALMAVGLFAASFYAVRHATEVKPYAIDLLLSLALTVLARRLQARPGSIPTWVALTAVAAAGVWASYPLIFVAAGVGLTLGRPAWRSRSRATLWAWSAFGGATVASWGAMYLLVARPQAMAAPFLAEMLTWEDSFPPLLRPWELPWWLLRTHTGNMMAYPYGGNNFGSLATAILVGLGVLVLWRRDRKLLALLLGPVGPALLAAALHRYPYGTSARISLFLAPAICLLAGQGLAALLMLGLPRKAARRGLFGLTAILAIAMIAGAVGAVALPYKGRADRETRRVVAGLAAESRPGDLWVGFNGLIELPRVKQLMLMPWLQHVAQLHYYALRAAPGRLDWNPRPAELADAPLPAGRTWFLLHHVGYDRFPADLVQRHLEGLVGRLGAPTLIRRFDPAPGEALVVYVFPAANPAPPGRVRDE